MGLEKFSAALDLLIGFQVNLYVGEDIFKGKLIGVEADHVVLETEGKYIFYYNIDKIQAITKNTKQFQPEKATVEFQKTQSLNELLLSFQYSWVTILTINKQSFYGVLSEIDEDFVTLINGEERILIKIIHVSNILKGFIKEKPKKKAPEKNETKNQDKETKGSNEEKESKESKQTNHAKKEDKDDTCQSPKEYTADQITVSEHKPCEKCDEVESSDKMELNHLMVWSNSIKAESLVKETKDHNSSIDKKHQDKNESMQMPKKEMKKPKNEMSTKGTKKDDLNSSKSNEKKSNKETEKTSKQPSSLSSSKKEQKNDKPQETGSASKPVVSQHVTVKKSEATSNEKVYNDTKNVWKQKDQETRAFRFTGEPVPKNKERTFPFAGWPSKNDRTFRF